MTDGADATGGAVFPHLTTDGGHSDMDVTRCLEIRIVCIGPDIALHLITCETCGNEDHLIHLAITIPVIDGEIGIGGGFQLLQCLFHRTVTIIIVTAFDFLANLKRTIDIELQVE